MRPLILIAGQSNAGVLWDSQDLTVQNGNVLSSPILLPAFAEGSPLTFPIDGPDWRTESELPSNLLQTISAALQADPQAYFAESPGCRARPTPTNMPTPTSTGSA